MPIDVIFLLHDTFSSKNVKMNDFGLIKLIKLNKRLIITRVLNS